MKGVDLTIADIRALRAEHRYSRARDGGIRRGWKIRLPQPLPVGNYDPDAVLDPSQMTDRSRFLTEEELELIWMD